MRDLLRNDWTIIVLAILTSGLTGLFIYSHANAVLAFGIGAIALAVLAALVGQATEQLGSRLSPGTTGVLQSAIGNLPELFVGIFALRAGLVTVVQSALIGSILANSLLVLGLAFLIGGLRHGTQRFDSQTPRLIAILTVLSVAALVVPTLAQNLHTAAAAHEDALSLACAIVLLIVFLASIPHSLQGGPTASIAPEVEHGKSWSLTRTLITLVLAGVAAAFVSDWFVQALEPAIEVLHLSQAFTGLVLVAIAGNAVENVVGIQLALRNKPDYAVSVILNSSLQVALALTPILVMLSFFLSPIPLTLVLPPLLVVALALAAILGALIVYDGESNWLEGVALIGLYGMIATAFWWG
ncbi:MAG TPA: calcium/proton exchanger [Anaerolineales bacterium]|nr:calcium/proton exchanger [Anaerolineales bacterium]